MDPLSQIMLLVLGTVFSVALLLLWLRFLMQLADVDYYSPFSQFVAKITTPLVKPSKHFTHHWPCRFGANCVDFYYQVAANWHYGSARKSGLYAGLVSG